MPRLRGTIDEVDKSDGNYRKGRRGFASTEEKRRPCSGVEKERRCGIHLIWSLGIDEAGVCLADRQIDDHQNSNGRARYLTVAERSPSRVRSLGRPDLFFKAKRRHPYTEPARPLSCPALPTSGNSMLTSLRTVDPLDRRRPSASRNRS